MPAALSNLVAGLFTSTGTGPFTITAYGGRQTLATAFGTSDPGVGNRPYLFIWNQDAGSEEWAVVTGHMTSSTSLTIDSTLLSSNGGSTVSWSAGTKYIGDDIPAAFQLDLSTTRTAGTFLAGPSSGAAAAPTFRTVAYADLSTLVRDRLTANRTYYVRTDGSDSNTGLVNSAGGAFLTIQHALDVVAALDISTFNATVQVVTAATWTQAVTVKQPVGAGRVILLGDTTTPANIVISTAGTCIAVAQCQRVDIAGFKLVSSGGGGILFQQSVGCTFGSMDFGAMTSGVHVNCDSSQISASNNYAVSGSAQAHWQASNGGVLDVRRTITISSNPTFSLAWAYCYQTGGILCPSCTFTGSQVITMTIASPAVVSWTAHGLSAGAGVVFRTTGALPTGVTAGTTYYVIAAGLTANAFQFSATPGGAAINTSGTQSGVHTVFSVTGSRYGVSINAWISTFGAGATYLPGNSAGSSGTGGEYV